MQKAPSFLIVGAPKCGTTSVHKYLTQNPSLFLPHVKETWFFCGHNNLNQTIYELHPYLPRTWLEYLDLFQDATEEQVCGEVTPSYMFYHELVIKNIYQFYPSPEELKIIFILREPISKVISHYKYVVKNNLDPEALTLWESLKQEKVRA
ncbi:MAG: sulfotransferase, partial [Bacteroidota bacterium]